MSIVIEFPVAKRSPGLRGSLGAGASVNASGAGAEILFFTGVRYERAPEVETPARTGRSMPTQRPVRKRKRRA